MLSRFSRRCVHSFSRQYKFFTDPSKSSLQFAKHLHTSFYPQSLSTQSSHSLSHFRPISTPLCRHFSSKRSDVSEDDDDDDDDDDDVSDDDDEDGIDDVSDDESQATATANAGGGVERVYSLEEKEKESAEIGYKVIGPLQPSEKVYKKYEPVYAVIQIGSHQFKVSNDDYIYVERLKFCEVNDKLILNRVLMLGSQTQTMIGRPILPNAEVHAVVEEHALDAKVIIFKKKRRKNYRRTKGHRQELTRLRIMDIQGIEKPEVVTVPKPERAKKTKTEKVAVAA
ncbi:50S ribosomal protein L21, mitochondrial [Impatiens glandulifera]|uniref:50S ribosomal protein L21, mitochondrial n=1 Tax=Impatiens glandulifera TaxID=253017 RepID=UPI001FB0A08C|nr:50S ribosomal protein L21, mitochondrial [Impatiens glandulifera]